MKRISRGRYLTLEEAAEYDAVRAAVEADKPEINARIRARMAAHPPVGSANFRLVATHFELPPAATRRGTDAAILIDCWVLLSDQKLSRTTKPLSGPTHASTNRNDRTDWRLRGDGACSSSHSACLAIRSRRIGHGRRV
jgi:hypothetical protein